MKVIQVGHRSGSYDVRFESVEAGLRALPSDVRVITDANVFEHYSNLIPSGVLVKVIEPGEHSKSLATLSLLLSWLAESRASRKTTICALGGGVVGDLVGFAAAVYMRGVPFVQIPTSLLAQVDSSVGGKVGVDLAEGKNLAGAFYPPVSVSIPIEALQTLPPRQFANGMAEVWKYGFIMDRELVGLLSGESLNPTHPLLPEIVHRCISLKAGIVRADEYETLGLRAILNFGHTVGHAIEYATGYGPVLHGEAISIGMSVEARLGEMLGVTQSGVWCEVKKHLEGLNLPVTHASLKDEDLLVRAMYADKKSTRGTLAFSLLTEIGGCRLVEEVDEGLVRRVLRES